MFTTTLARRTNNDGLATIVDRFFTSDPFFGGRWTSGPTTRAASVDGWSPSVDVYEEESGYVFTADLPGLKKEDVSLTVEDGVLTITGERKSEREVEPSAFQRLERSFGKFTRRFSLPSQVDASKVEAGFTDGVLTVKVPKSEAAKPHRVEIQ